MSRTIRNKRNEKRRYGYSGKESFSKFDSDYDYVDLYRFYRSSSHFYEIYAKDKKEKGWENGWHESRFVFRKKKTKKELYEERWIVNGESKHSNYYSPSREYRQSSERALRVHNKRELKKFKTLEDYEPICYETPKSHIWEWR